MKRSISSRIILSYIVIILVAVFFSSLLFRVMAVGYMERQARIDLYNDARTIADHVRKAAVSLPDSDTNRVDKLRQLVKDLSGLQSLESQWALIDGRARLLNPIGGTPNVEFAENILPAVTIQLKANNLKNVFSIDSGNVQYMAIIYPASDGAVKAASRLLVLYTSVGAVRQLAGGFMLVMIISSLLTGIVAVIFGVFIARSLAKPIVALKRRAEALAMRDFDTKTVVKTGDELEDLADSFDTMSAHLKEYDVAQKRFMQNASHELKTPLMSIQGYAEGIKDGVFEDGSRALDIIIEESVRLKGIVDEVIYLSKLETMEDYYTFTEGSINALLDKTADKLRSIALKNDIRLNTVYYKDAVLMMDPDKMTQALINIIGNCIKYARHEVEIVTSNDSRKLEISISDDGEGFASQDLPHIFERFYRGRKGDTGLGLAISKIIVEKHCGTVTASNKHDGGAQFKLVLPVDHGRVKGDGR